MEVAEGNGVATEGDMMATEDFMSAPGQIFGKWTRELHGFVHFGRDELTRRVEKTSREGRLRGAQRTNFDFSGCF